MAFTQRDKETKDILSLGVVFEKEFSSTLSADLGMCYDIGWGTRNIYTTLASVFETFPIPSPQLLIKNDGSGKFQDLTLTTHLTVKPTDRLSLAFGGMVKIPLETLDYDTNGNAAGLEAFPLADRPGYFFGGPFFMGYESRGWDWGGLFSVTYEFGCPKPVPPVVPAPPAPAPQLTPMSQR